MNGEPSAVHVIRLITEQVKKLCVKNGYDKVESIVSIGNDNKQCHFAIAYGIKLHFVLFQ